MPSSVISTFQYDKVKAVLRIIFTSGAVYEYLNVPEKAYRGMAAAFSKGTYFNRYIKDHFRFKKTR